MSALAVTFGILGPLELRVGNAPAVIVGARRRALLARLVLDANRVVPADRLIEDLWGDRLPEHPTNALQAYISHLRSVVEVGRARSGPNTVIVTRPPGYVVVVKPKNIDAFCFSRLAAEGRVALVEDRVAQASDTLTESLDLWRGPALAEFADAPWAQAEVARLEELRWATLEDRMEADLALGRHGAVVGEAEAAVAEQPMRERFWAHRMLALYRCGRQAEALRAYAKLRRVLVDDLGIEPSPELVRLEGAILVQSPELDIRRGRPVQAPRQPVLMRQPGLEERTPLRTAYAKERASLALAGVRAPETHNFPRLRSGLVGRQGELEEVDKLLEVSGLVTLVGPGGVGKTRLAVELARRVRGGRYPDGAWLVELAPLADASLVAEAAASALGIREDADRPLFDTLVAAVADRRLLVVLDNCEHLLGAAARLADALLESAPGLAVLATSREPLRLEGEMVFPLAPLSLPPEGIARPDLALDYDAVRLFCERASAQGRFALDTHNVTAVVGVCRRLDGIPLALELAAARSAALAPGQMLARLDDRFALLSEGNRTALPRHQTLRAAIAWSYDLLTAAQQALFRRLGVFAGRFSIDAAQQVCLGDELTRDDIAVLLADLVERSLVLAHDDERYSLLETVRVYTLERLSEGEASALRLRHIEWLISIAFSVPIESWDAAEAEWLDRLEAERANLHEALDWGLSANPDCAVRLAARAGYFWVLRGHLHEGRSWLETSLDKAACHCEKERATILTHLGVIAQHQGDLRSAQERLEEAISAFRALGDDSGVAECARLLALVLHGAGETDDARPLLELSGAFFRNSGDTGSLAAVLGGLGIVAVEAGDYAGGETLLSEAVERSRSVGDFLRVAGWLDSLGVSALDQADMRRAEELLNQALELSGDLRNSLGVAHTVGNLGLLAFHKGDLQIAAKLLGEELAAGRRMGTMACVAHALWGLGRLGRLNHDYEGARSLLTEALEVTSASSGSGLFRVFEEIGALVSADGDDETATVLVSAARHLRELARCPLAPVETPCIEGGIRRLRSALGTRLFGEMWVLGQSTELHECVLIARDALNGARIAEDRYPRVESLVW